MALFQRASARLRGERPAAVAGTFYPDDRRALAGMVDDFLVRGREREVPAAFAAPPKVLIAPHAGYPYSGPVAGSAFAVAPATGGDIRRVVLIGPSHHVPLEGLALPAADRFTTPLGTVELDLETAAQLCELPQVRVDARPHAREHSLEVELPFLQRLLGTDAFALVPLVVGRASPAEVAAVLEAVWGGDETLVVISSDLSHFLDYDQACRVDRATADAIVAGAGPLDSAQACGAAAINGLLALPPEHRAGATLLDLRNSGDVAGGRDRVVGYGAFAFAFAPASAAT